MKIWGITTVILCLIGLGGSGISKTFSTCMSSALWKAGEKPVSSLVVLPDTNSSPIHTGTDRVNWRWQNAQERGWELGGHIVALRLGDCITGIVLKTALGSLLPAHRSNPISQELSQSSIKISTPTEDKCLHINALFLL